MAVRTAEREQGNKINFLHQIFLHLLFRVYIYLFTLVKKCKYIITYVYIYMYVCVCFVRFFVFERKGLGVCVLVGANVCTKWTKISKILSILKKISWLLAKITL